MSCLLLPVFEVNECLISLIFHVQGKGDGRFIDPNKTTETLESEETSSGGLFVPGKDRVMFKPPERKSLLGMLSYHYVFIKYRSYFCR